MSLDHLLTEARQHIGHVQESLGNTQVTLETQFKKLMSQYPKAEGAEKMTLHTLLQYTKKRQHELTALHPSPYFSRCDVIREHKDATVYIGKFSFPEESIVSWVSPISTLRFEHPGPATYTTPDRTKKPVVLTRKDEYMITDGSVLFFATESIDTARTLVYQENFSNRKTGFVLPEIIARMEEAQDKVIRSSWRGPLVISGPAGSGKTTLALHRVAYLMQVPEIQDHFPGHRIRVFVQDPGTKSYFATLLPDLGIDNVEITTFRQWAHDILELVQNDQATEVQSEYLEDILTNEKLQILREFKTPLQGEPLRWLKNLYSINLTNSKNIVLSRIEKNILDDIDLTILLQAYKKSNGTLRESREYFMQQKNKYEIQRKIGRFDVSYNLCVVDEFQNYLPEQLQLIRGCMNEETQSIVYVGDMRQQTRFGTVQSWNQIGENIDDSRLITLEKVYRNTKEILQYIESLGYVVSIPEALPQGTPVQVLAESVETPEHISTLAVSHTDRLVGILAKNTSELLPYLHLATHKHIKVMTIREAQGVEFDTVFLVGNTQQTWQVDPALYTDVMRKEKTRINKDLLYVALTRAMRELYVVGTLPHVS